MKKYFIFTISALIFLISYTLLLKYVSIIKTKPDIILIMVIYVAVTSDKDTDIFIAFSLGYLFDIFSGSTIGFFTMLRTITYLMTRFFNMKFFSMNAYFFMLITFAVSILDSIYLSYHFLGGGYRFFGIIWDCIYLSLINSVTALIMYPLLERIERLYLKVREEEQGRY